jgi:serine/threonine-protein kinase
MTDILERLRAALSGRYQIERELGQGGMATVYLARDLRHERHVALKVLRPELAATLGSERFLREIRIAANLTHPHILPLHDSGEADGFLFYVMPYIEGESLRARLAREGELPVPDAARILKEVTDALAHAHAHGVVHRDIKPDNVLLAGRHALVTDFGVAKAVSEATGRDQLTTAGVALGTPMYMAPEQATGDPHIDARVDIYAVGAMGYELLSGRPPFTGPSAQAVLAAQVTEAPKPVTEHRPAVPPTLATVIMKCLEKKPADRWQTADELLQHFEAAVTPSAGVTPTSARPAVLSALATRRSTAVAGAVVTVVLVGTWLAVRRGGSLPLDPNLVAVFPFQFSAGPELAYLREGIVNLLESDLTGQVGPRAVSSQTAISAWKREGGSAEVGLTEEEEKRTAKHLGAGLLLRGGIVGSGSNIVINATLRSVTGSTSPVQVAVSGSPDSIATLARQLAAQLLSLKAGEEAPRAASLADVPLPALRAYLEGQVAYREGQWETALAAFGRALDVDSTFALAALYHALSSGWVITAAPSPGLRLAWAYRDRLSPRDQALLETYRPTYPAPPSYEEQLRAAERGVQVLSDRVEAWYILGDEIFHRGRVIGMTEAQVRERSAAAFERARQLDPDFGPALTHAIDGAIFNGDTARLRKLVDSLPGFFHASAEHGLAAAVLLGDSARLERWRSRLSDFSSDALAISNLYGLLFDAASEAFRALDELERRAGSEAERYAALAARQYALWRTGQPRAAAMLTDRMARELRNLPVGHDHSTVLAALLADGDTAQAARAVGRLTASDQPPAGLCTAGMWYAAQGNAARAGSLMERLQGLAAGREAAAARLLATVCAAQLRVLLAGPGELRAAAEALDSLIRTGPGIGADQRNTANLALARAFESLGDPRRARGAAQRWDHFGAVTTWPAFREWGRLALLAGDTAEARYAWDWYLRSRDLAEPEQRAKDDVIREQLGRLVGERRE